MKIRSDRRFESFLGWSGLSRSRKARSRPGRSLQMEPLERRTLLDGSGLVSIGDVEITEGDSGTKVASFTVSLSDSFSQAVTVDYATVDGTAVAGSDYEAATGTLTFAAEETSRTISVNVLGDDVAEATERFTVELSNPAGGALSLGDAEGTATILDNDQITLTVDDLAVREGNASQAQFTVRLSKASASAVTVNYATTDGTAVAGTDYTATSGTLTFAAGETERTVTVDLANADDTLVEEHRSFFLSLSGAAGAIVGDSTGEAALQDDDAPLLSVADVTAAEGGNLVFTIEIDQQNGVDMNVARGDLVQVGYATSNGSAKSDEDYTAASGTLSIDPFAGEQTVTVTTLDDSKDEADETVYLNLIDAYQVGIGDGLGLGTLQDNDAEPTLSISDVAIVEGDSGTVNAVFTVTLSAATYRNVTVNYATSSDGATAAAGTDYAAASGTLTFTPGQLTRKITVAVNGDQVNEAAETFHVELSSPSGATLADDKAVGTITDDDDATITITDAQVTETDAGSVQVALTVSISAAGEESVTVQYATADDTAAAGSDYRSQSGTLTFSGTETTKQLTLTVYADKIDELDEEFLVQFSSAVGGSLANSEATVTILDNDDVPTYSIDDVEIVEGASGSSYAEFTVTLSSASGKSVAVDYEAIAGTAAIDVDFEHVTGTITFEPGETTQTILVPVYGDEEIEADETFTLALSDAENATAADAEGLATIENDDYPTVTVGDVTIDEADANQTVVVTVSLSAASSETVTVKYQTQAVTETDSDEIDPATSGADFESRSGTVIFAAGETSKTITLVVLGDTIDEWQETFQVVLSDPSGAIIGDGGESADGVSDITIVDNDAAPLMSVSNAEEVAEGDSGTVSVVFTVALSEESGKEVTAEYSTYDYTAVAGEDYQFLAGTVTFAPGETEKTITVQVIGDTQVESDERFRLILENPTHAAFSSNTPSDEDNIGLAFITDDDYPTVSIGDASVSEPDSGTQEFTLTVSLSQASDETVTVQYATSAVTAIAGSDYKSKSGTITFAPGETSKQITLVAFGDTIDEGDETFSVILSNAVGGTVATDGTGTGTVTILGSDTKPSITVDDVEFTEGQSSKSVTFTLTLSAESGRTVTVDYATGDAAADSASSDDDYTVTSGTATFAPEETTVQVTVPILGDGEIEGDEQFLLNLFNATNATLADDSGLATILNDDFEFASADAGQTIPDQGTLRSTIEVTQAMVVAGVEVEVDITHANVSDLTLYLVAPDGTRVELASAVGGSGANFTGTLFDASAETGIADASAPFTGSYQPEGDLSALSGAGALGTWVLEVVDSGAGDVGTLNSWTLHLHNDAQESATLGRITYVELSDLDPTQGAVWYTFEAANSGPLSLLIAAASSDDDVQVTLYNAAETKLVASAYSSGYQRLDYTVVAGQTYKLRVTGSRNDVDLVVANLIRLSGTTAEVSGTSGDDTFEFDGASPKRILVKGISYQFASALTSVTFDGVTGNDSALLYGTSGADTLVMHPGDVVLSGSGYSVEVLATAQVVVQGREGDDTATLYDSAVTDSYVGSREYGRMIGGGYDNKAISFWETVGVSANGGQDQAVLRDTTGDDELHSQPASTSITTWAENLAQTTMTDVLVAQADGFALVQVASTGGADTAVFFDGAGDDTFTVTPDLATLEGEGYAVEATGFADARAFASTGGTDTAVLYDTSATDTFTATSDYVRMAGTGYFARATGFEVGRGVSSAGGSDVARLYDAAGADTLSGTIDNVTLTGESGKAVGAQGFASCNVFATNGSSDAVEMNDSAGDDTLLLKPADSRFTNASTFLRLSGFESVHVLMDQGGSDSASLLGSSGVDHYRGWGNSGTLTGTNYAFTVETCEALSASGKGGTSDTVELYDSAGDDTFSGTSTFGRMAAASYINRASFFDTVVAYSQNGGADVARLYDGAGNDTLVASPTAARLYGSTFDNTATGFATVHAFASSGGTDLARLSGSSGADTLDGRPDTTQLAGTGYALRVVSFDKVYADLSQGGSDAVLLYDSTSADELVAGEDQITLAAKTGSYLIQATGLAADDTATAKSNTSGDGDQATVAADLLFTFALKGTWES